jgi:hypothetical protein
MRHNEGPMRRLRTAICTLLAVLASATLHAQAIDSGSIFRIFLKDGAALPSYGDYAVVGDRLVFALAIGQDSSQVQVMSLPAASVDLDRTARYARSVRAAHYARTRGEADYAAITDEVTRALDHLTRVEDPLKRLALAEEAKRRLLKWSGDNYSYRAADVRELARLFDEVIAELRVAAGQSTFSLEFSTGPLVPDLEPLWPAPAFSESLNVALAAARAADMPEERVGILRAALAAIPDDEANSRARAILGREIEAELDADAAYARLSASLLARAERSMQQGDVRGVSAVEAELTVRDDGLGQRRRGFVASLAAQLRAMVERTALFRLALDHYALVRGHRLQYERRVRPVLTALDGAAAVLAQIRDMNGVSYQRLEDAEKTFTRLRTMLDPVVPPDGLAAVHATLGSALRMAEQACARRREAVVTTSLAAAREASSAASGAILLSAQARGDLVRLLYPPRADAVR